MILGVALIVLIFLAVLWPQGGWHVCGPVGSFVCIVAAVFIAGYVLGG